MTMTDANGWYTRNTRKRKEGVERSSDDGLPLIDPSISTKIDASSSSSPSASPATNKIPASLMPHLGWTKLSSACHSRTRVKRRKRIDANWDRDEGVRKVAGRAIFFIHDPRPTYDGEDGGHTNKDESKIWFQGRFFPSSSSGLFGNNGNGGGRPQQHSRKPSPTSVASASSSGRTFSAPDSSIGGEDSWGLLAVQNEIVDECLTCAEGGYRELDLTFVRNRRGRRRRPASPNGRTKEEKKRVRWAARDVVWTGGNMMALASDYYAPRDDGEPGVRFVPEKLVEGRRAMETASRYFPSMVKRLRIRELTNGGDDEDGGEPRGNDDAMVIIGDMEVVAPASFVSLGNNNLARASRYRRDDEDSDDDGLWDD